MKTANQQKRAKKRQLAHRRDRNARTLNYTLPAPAVLPDLRDDTVFREQLAQAARRERSSRWSNFRHFLYQLIP